MPAFFKGQRVYFNHSERGWILGLVEGVLRDGRVICTDVEGHHRDRVSADHVHMVLDGGYDPHDPDLFRVNDLHVTTLMACVSERYAKLHAQYSKLGVTVLSVNPFEAMAYNSDRHRETFLRSPHPERLEPHIWQVADLAYRRLMNGEGNQSVLVSGESGSGKTENTKSLIGYLGELSAMRSANALQKEVATRVSQRLYHSNALIESFGNARTVRNDNSSRFGRYTKLYFDARSGIMVGGEMRTYLLEKSRVVSLNAGERNYHIFYEMLAGLTKEHRDRLGLRDVKQYRCLTQGGQTTRRGIDGRPLSDAEQFKEVVRGMQEVNISFEQQGQIFSALAAILHLSDVEFATGSDDRAQVKNLPSVETACRMLGVTSAALMPCLLVKSQTKVLTTRANKEEAEALRDAFVKALYVGLFEWIIDAVNAAVVPASTEGTAYIGLLDIFGFENFALNSFEQLCINYANEALQNHYNKHTFADDEADCQAEGIPFPKLQLPDNSECLKMFEVPKKGMFALLDEESNVRGGSSERFTSNVWSLWKDAKAFVLPKTTIPAEFGINHYACFVSYNTRMWVEKNADALKEDVRELCMGSSAELIRTILEKAETNASDGQNRKKVNVCGKFMRQLSTLREELHATQTHFIRCIKPNTTAEPRVVDWQYVGTQLESAGVLQTIIIKRQGYPVRKPIEDFMKRYFSISPRIAVEQWRAGQANEAADATLRNLQRIYSWAPPHFAVGRTKVFMRPDVHLALERQVHIRNRTRLRRVIPHLQRWIRHFRKKKEEEERRRLEKQREMQEQARRRAEQEAQMRDVLANSGGEERGISPRSLGGTNGNSGSGGGLTRRGSMMQNYGLDDTRRKWFKEVAYLFPNMELPVLLDVVCAVPTKAQAVQALMSMQQQMLDDTIPMRMKVVFQKIGVRPEMVAKLASKGIVSLEMLSEHSEAGLIQLGFNPKEISGIVSYMISQQSAVVANERLQALIGGGKMETLVQHMKHAPAPVDAKIERLMALGVTQDRAEAALQKCEGDVVAAGNVLLARRRRSTHSSPAGGPTGEGGTPRLPQIPPRHLPPSVAVEETRTPRASSRHSAKVDPAAVDRLEAQGFRRTQCVAALVAAKGNVTRALDLLKQAHH